MRHSLTVTFMALFGFGLVLTYRPEVARHVVEIPGAPRRAEPTQ